MEVRITDLDKIGITLTPQELSIICGALSTEKRYCLRNLDRAKEQEAIDGWARRAMELGDLLRKLGGEP